MNNFLFTVLLCFYLHHRWELPGNYPVFTVVMVIYHYVERIWRILVTPVFCITYMIINIYYTGEQLGNYHQKRVRVNYHYCVVMDNW